VLYAIARDITGRRPADVERDRALAGEHAAAIAQREELLASVCHDMQQPLTVILAQTQLLQRQLAHGETLPREKLVQRLAHIFAAATRMRGMTQDLVDASVKQSGHALALLLARTELVALTRQAVREHEVVSDLHQFVFEAEPTTLEATVDEERVPRILGNLLSNAVKYSPAGGAVCVSVKATDGPDGKAAVLIVRDEGVASHPMTCPTYSTGSVAAPTLSAASPAPVSGLPVRASSWSYTVEPSRSRAKKAKEHLRGVLADQPARRSRAQLNDECHETHVPMEDHPVVEAISASPPPASRSGDGPPITLDPPTARGVLMGPAPSIVINGVLPIIFTNVLLARGVQPLYVRFALAKNSFFTAAFGAVFLCTLVVSKPIMCYAVLGLLMFWTLAYGQAVRTRSERNAVRVGAG
jgi:hypothetical protein